MATTTEKGPSWWGSLWTSVNILTLSYLFPPVPCVRLRYLSDSPSATKPSSKVGWLIAVSLFQFEKQLMKTSCWCTGLTPLPTPPTSTPKPHSPHAPVSSKSHVPSNQQISLQNVVSALLHVFAQQRGVSGGCEEDALHDSGGPAGVHSAIWRRLLPPSKSKTCHSRAADQPQVKLILINNNKKNAFVEVCFIHPFFIHHRTSTTVPSWLQGQPCSSWTVSWQGRWGTEWLWSGEAHEMC